MSLTTRVLWIVERNLREPHTLESLAAAAGVSRFHLAHAFAQTAGWPVLHYLRARRLSEAAHALAAGAPDILTLALDAGYGSHEAFTRAFREQLGKTPEAVRKRGSVDGLRLVEPLVLPARPAPALAAPRLVQRPAQTFLGLRARHRLGEAAGIAGQWEQFMRSFDGFDDAEDPIPWGLSGDLGEDGTFAYLCAVQVRAQARARKPFEAVRLAAQEYAVFTHEGHASQLAETYRALWDEWLPASGRTLADAFCLEQHRPQFDPATGVGGMDIWVPLAA